MSTWDDDVCTGAVGVPASDAAALIALLADGLADAIETEHPAAPPAATASGELKVRGRGRPRPT